MKTVIYDDINFLCNEINNYPILTQGDIEKLFDNYKNGDINAREKIINSNLKLVISIANKYISKTESFSFADLVQEGSLGLMRAIETYNKNKSSFSTYAYLWIEQYIKRSLNVNDKLIRKPDYFFNLNYNYNKLINEYIKKNKEMPDDEYIMKKLDI